MTLLTARHYAEKLTAWLSPVCPRLEIAGSIRRGLANCNDVDVVIIPQLHERKDLFGGILHRDNLTWAFLTNYVQESAGKATIQSGGKQAGESIIIQLPKCQLDVWFATEETFASVLLCRTGSKEHNIWLADRAAAAGLHWTPNRGLCQTDRRTFLPARTEQEIYEHLKLPYIEPQNREWAWLAKNIDLK